jgi:hypothetical protein
MITILLVSKKKEISSMNHTFICLHTLISHQVKEFNVNTIFKKTQNLNQEKVSEIIYIAQ